jgi:hypothetical protein
VVPSEDTAATVAVGIVHDAKDPITADELNANEPIMAGIDQRPGRETGISKGEWMDWGCTRFYQARGPMRKR